MRSTMRAVKPCVLRDVRRWGWRSQRLAGSCGSGDTSLARIGPPVSPFAFGSDATVGLATVAQVGAELLRGGRGSALLPLGNRYAALALILSAAGRGRVSGLGFC